MRVVAGILGVLVASFGLLGLFFPSRLLAFIARWQSQAGLYVATFVRLLLGVALVLSAPGSRTPDFLRVLGIIVIVAGIATPLIGLRRFEALLRWWSESDESYLRAYSFVLLALGGSIVWAVAP